MTYSENGVTIHVGDALTVLRTLPSESVNCCVTSPPYAMQRAGFYAGVEEGDYPAWTVAWLEASRHALKPDASVFIVIREHIRAGQMSDYVHLTRLAVRAAGWLELDELIWIKPCSPPVGNINRPRRSWERILWFSRTPKPYCQAKKVGNKVKVCLSGEIFNTWLVGKAGVGKWEGVPRYRDYIEIGTSRCCKTGHPAAFPEGLASWLIELGCPPGGVVLDPFFGSGTTGQAARSLGRQAVGIELNPDYIELCSERLSRETGPKP